MVKLYEFPGGRDIDNTSHQPHTNVHGGGSGGGSDMEPRVKALEDKVGSIVTDIAVIKSNYATKEDVSTIRVDIAAAKTQIADSKAELHSALRTQALTIIGSMIAIAGITCGIIIKYLAH